MTAIIHQLRRRPKSFTTNEALIDALRSEIFKSKMTYKDIAHKVGCNSTTIHNLASGKTRWPRPTTLFPLLQVLGKRIYIGD